MSFIQFDKSHVVNLEYALSKEILRTNSAGAYSCTTLAGCNTRKYHGLLIAPQPEVDGDPHVLLSSLDISVEQQGAEFNLGLHRYKGGTYAPKGHKYLREFKMDPIPTYTYRVGGVVLKCEQLFMDGADRLLIRYTLEEATSPTKLHFKPFLAFRNAHFLTRANRVAKTDYNAVDQGISMCLYSGYSPLFMQFSKPANYDHNPTWYYDIEYIKEIERGYDAHEDLLQNGSFVMDLKKGESVVFSAGTSLVASKSLSKAFEKELSLRKPIDNFENCLSNAASQFLVTRDNHTELIAGFPYFGKFSRDTFMALPGLTLSQGDLKTCKCVLDALVEASEGPFFPIIVGSNRLKHHHVDTPLWFFRALQKYTKESKKHRAVWKEMGGKMKQILSAFKSGTDYGIYMHSSGLLHAEADGLALTWMDAVVEGSPVTQRPGFVVEVNALWYNAICFALELAEISKDQAFIDEWAPIAAQIPKAFEQKFWSDDRGYLADYVTSDGYQDWSVRPNQILAASLPHSPISEEKRKDLLSVVRKELLTQFGLRTLSPKNSLFHNEFRGNQVERDLAYHNGPAFPWLLEHYTEGYLRIHGKGGLSFIKGIYSQFQSEVLNHGVGTISELYEPDPPHRAAGAISHAISVAALMRMKEFIDRYEAMP